MVLVLRIPAPQWDRGAKCLGSVTSPEDDYYFEHGGDDGLALDVCNGDTDGKVCPLRHQCLMFALVNNETSGVWGGMRPEDRHMLRRTTPREEWGWRPPTQDDPVDESLLDV